MKTVSEEREIEFARDGEKKANFRKLHFNFIQYLVPENVIWYTLSSRKIILYHLPYYEALFLFVELKLFAFYDFFFSLFFSLSIKPGGGSYFDCLGFGIFIILLNVKKF